jgi:nucleoside-diphosphate-sugar epimerase
MCGEYGAGKAEIEARLHRETLAGGVPAVVLHPGHITGPGWPVITPAGNLDPAVWTCLATGQPLALTSRRAAGNPAQAEVARFLGGHRPEPALSEPRRSCAPTG